MSDDDLFAALTEGLEVEEPTDVLDVTKLDSVTLTNMAEDVRQELFEREEMRDPRSERGRELHSMRNALLLELRKRGLR